MPCWLGGEKKDEVKKNMNDKPFEFRTSDGSVFTCERSDFSLPIKVRGIPIDLNAEANLSMAFKAVAEMIAYHRSEIWPHVTGFSGYDCLAFVEDEEKENGLAGFGPDGPLGKGDGD